MRLITAFVLLVTGVLLAPGRTLAQEDELASPKLRIEWAAFKKLYDAKGAVVVDVRDPVSFGAGHIPGARSIPLADVERFAAELKALKKPIVLYCA